MNNKSKLYILSLCIILFFVNNLSGQNTSQNRNEFLDYSDVQIGDYYFADGTISHKLSEKKQCVGVVFSLKTTDIERAKGWTHGQIVALADVEKGQGYRWMSLDADCSKCCAKTATIADCRADKNGYSYSHAIWNNWVSIDNNAFGVAHYYNFRESPLLKSKISDWYLPSIGQWYDIIENLGHVKILADGNFNDMKRAQRNLDEKIGLAPTMYWSSSSKSFRGAWVVVLRAGNINSYDKNFACSIRAVAAF